MALEGKAAYIRGMKKTQETEHKKVWSVMHEREMMKQ
jgi:hypothetical protein